MTASINVVRDPKHPDFPHGTALGRRRHCDCTPCRDAKYREDKRLHLQRLTTGSNRYASPEVTARVVAHLNHLNSIPGVSLTMIGKWAGTSHSSAVRVMATGTVGPKLAKQFLSITPAFAAAHARAVPRDEVVLKVHQMQALGYPIAWQQTQIGRPRCLYTLVNRTSETVEAPIAHDVFELAARIGDRPANPGDGMTAAAINHAKGRARKAGYYPPACYNEDGTLDYRAIPDHPWSRADEQAHRKLDLLRALVKYDGFKDRPEIAAELGRTDREAERLVAQYRLTLSESRRKKRLAWLRGQFDRFDTDNVDPVLFALQIDLYEGTRTFPLDHPGVVAWREQHPEHQTPTQRKTELQRARRATARMQNEQVAA